MNKNDIRYRSRIQCDPKRGYRACVEFGTRLEKEGIGPWESESAAENRLKQLRERIVADMAAIGGKVTDCSPAADAGKAER